MSGCGNIPSFSWDIILEDKDSQSVQTIIPSNGSLTSPTRQDSWPGENSIYVGLPLIYYRDLK